MKITKQFISNIRVTAIMNERELLKIQNNIPQYEQNLSLNDT